MSEMTAVILLGIALVIVAGLGAYAWTLWKEVRRREAFKRDEVRRANEMCLESLDAIAKAILQEQVDLTEGALRCKVLLEIIDPALMERQSFQIFGVIQSRTAHLHTHSAREALSPKERMKEDRQRWAIEEEHRQEVLDAARAVLEFKSSWPGSLH
ncbi:hypothetical protein GCM10007160_03750 [Litchfieldella qijiaojingensis]|uniref:DUF2489 domain-containing protein n=1 Tax=Litchfieldella qijiaojingensis TaxID=980347 RepID=A0ABQ2YEH1_9GAMM|nr:DUF2489 domain-containing protein [Halomonas qijiaojingensis]GGX79643.1 hypothetical protein GCM10007160_03750 [Halomonas qijiaojingensis]